MDPVDEIFRLLRTKGQAAYHGEAVSQLEHALQAARLAEMEGATVTLVVAALLHDVGHLVHEGHEDQAERGVDARHEELGHAWLQSRFPEDVTGPIRLHVEAKRYLCAVDPAYRGSLSPASLLSLRLQGGPMRDEEIARFEAQPYSECAIRLRRWDDAAKVPRLDVAGLDSYRDRIRAVTRPGGSA